MLISDLENRLKELKDEFGDIDIHLLDSGGLHFELDLVREELISGIEMIFLSAKIDKVRCRPFNFNEEIKEKDFANK